MGAVFNSQLCLVRTLACEAVFETSCAAKMDMEARPDKVPQVTHKFTDFCTQLSFKRSIF